MAILDWFNMFIEIQNYDLYSRPHSLSNEMQIDVKQIKNNLCGHMYRPIVGSVKHNIMVKI